MARFSIASLAGGIVLIGVALGCLLHAASPWAGLAVVAFCALLGAAPLGIVYRRGGSQAFYVGCTFWAWTFLVLSAIPHYAQLIAAVTDWYYPRIIVEDRQWDLSRAVVSDVRLSQMAAGQDLGNLGNAVDIDLDGSPFMEGITTVTDSNPRGEPKLKLLMHRDKARALRTELAAGRTPSFRQHRGALPSRVDPTSFARVGKAVLGLLSGLIGGLIARWFYGSRRSS